MDKEGVCCCCGGKYVEYGFSTWGLWTKEEEKLCWGEDKRACKKCNNRIICFVRREKAYALRAGKINTVMDDLFEVLYEEQVEDSNGQLLYKDILYSNGLYRIIYGSEPQNNTTETIFRFKIFPREVTKKIYNVVKKYQSFIETVPEYLENPYIKVLSDKISNPEILQNTTTFCFGKNKVSVKGHLSPEEVYPNLEESNILISSEAIFSQIAILDYLKTEIYYIKASCFGRYGFLYFHGRSTERENMLKRRELREYLES